MYIQLSSLDDAVKSRCLGITGSRVWLQRHVSPSKRKEAGWDPLWGCLLPAGQLLSALPLHSETSPPDPVEDIGCSEEWTHSPCKAYSVKHTSADGNWCLGFPIEGQVADYIQDHLTRIEQQTKPQITELHMPSDNNSHPHTHTLGVRWEWAGVKSIYCICVMRTFYSGSGLPTFIILYRP